MTSTTQTDARRDVTSVIHHEQRLQQLLLISRRGDQLKTDRATLVLLSRTGGRRGNLVELARLDTGERYAYTAGELTAILRGRTVTFHRPEVVVVPPVIEPAPAVEPEPVIEPEPAVDQRRAELEAELAGLNPRTKRARAVKAAIAALAEGPTA